MIWLNADDFDSLQSAFEAARSSGQTLYIPKRIYELDEPIRLSGVGLSHPITIVGDWPVIRARSPMCSLLEITGPAEPLSLTRVILDGNEQADHGLSAFKLNGALSSVRQVLVRKTKGTGYNLEKCQASVWSGLQASRCGEHGFFILDCNAAVFHGSRALSCGQSGFVIGANDFSGGCTLNAFTSEGNGGHGVHVLGRSNPWAPIRLTNGWLEQNRGDGVYVESKNVVMFGLAVSVRGRPSNRSIRLLNTSAGCHITGCYVPRARPIRVESAVESHYIQGNFYHDGAVAGVEVV